MHSMNLYQVDNSMAEELSAQYTVESTLEGISINRCPHTIDIDITPAEEDGSFFLKRMSQYQNVEP